MLSANEKITTRQFQILILLETFGTGVIILPRRAAEYAAQDGWLIVAGLTALALLIGALLTSAARIFPSASFITYTRRILTRPVAYAAGICLLFKLLVGAGLELRLFADITRQTILKNTPMPAVCALMLLTAAYAAARGMETRARVGEILGYLVVLPLLLFFVIAFFDIDLSNLQPLLITPPGRIVSGTLRLGYIFTGLESLLLVFPYLNHTREGRRSALRAIALGGLLIVLITLITIAKFGPDDLAAQPWPVLRMMDMLNIPGSFIERQDALVFSFWIISLFMVMNAALFYGAVLFKDLCRRGRHDVFTVISAVIVLGLACLPLEPAFIYRLLDGLYGTFGVFYLLFFPLVLWITARLRGFTSGGEPPMNDPTEEPA